MSWEHVDRREALGALAAAGALLGMPSPLLAKREVSSIERFVRMRRTVATSVGKVAYARAGAGDPILFIHAYPLNGFEWRGYFDRLAGRHLCIAPDMLALGYSEPSSLDITPMSQVRMIVDLLAHLHLSKVHVVGNDSGGAVAQLLAAYHPERIRSLLLTNCDVGPDNPPASFQAFVDLARAGRLIDKFIMPQLADLNAARSVHGLGFAYSNPGLLTAEIVAHYLAPIVSSARRRKQFDNYTVSLGSNLLADAQPRLERMNAPVRVIWGGADPFFSKSDPDYLARTFPNFTGTHIVPDGKLYFPEEMPDLVIAEAAALWGPG